jgi:enterochelin esterase-like enzyme
MNMRGFEFGVCGAAFVVVVSSAGCSDANGPPGSTANSGSAGSSGSSGAGAGASAGTSGSGSGANGATTGAASAGATGGDASTGSASGASGSSLGGGDAGEGGASSGAADAGAAPDGASGKGVQSDPGVVGDGTTMLPGPSYVVPPESMGLLNGATAGTLTPPALYASKTVYPGISFQYSIYVPSQYQKGKPAALMIFLDAREWVTAAATATTVAWTNQGGWNAPTVLDNLIHSGDVPVSIAVFIDPGTPSGKFTGSGADNNLRSIQYDHPDNKYSQFTLTELLPDVVFSKYDIVQDPDGWCGVGHSSGGIAVFNMAFLNPDKFHKALTFSASFPNTGGVYPNKINTTPTLPIRIHLLSGPNDLGNGTWYSTNTTAAADLLAKGYHYQYIIGTSMHFPSPAAVQDFPPSLRWMWRNYKLPWYP